MPSSWLLMVFAVFASVGLVSYAVLDAVFADDRRVSRRLKELTEYERAQAAEAQPILKPFRERILSPVGTSVGRATHALWPADYRDRVAQRLERAGNPRGLDATRFLAAKVVLAIGVALLMLLVAFFLQWGLALGVMAVLIPGTFTFFGPDMWLSNVLRSRQHRVVRELPDMLDMLTISVEAGLGFDASLSKLVRNSQGPLAEEFGRALQEVQAGASRKEALKHLAARVDVPELSSFTASIIQAEMFGISIAQVLHTQAAEMRLRRRQRAEEEAQKAPVKMVIPLVVCILPATLIVVAGPAIMRAAVIFK